MVGGSASRRPVGRNMGAVRGKGYTSRTCRGKKDDVVQVRLREYSGRAGLQRMCQHDTRRDVSSRVIDSGSTPDTSPTIPFTPGSSHLHKWSPRSWREKEVLQQPEWPCEEELNKACDIIQKMPPLVFAGECRKLQGQLADAAVGKAFLLQGGDCAESFDDFTANHIRDTYRVMLQMAVVLQYGAGKPVIKVGRMAGQFAKPRSSGMEDKGGVSLPSYRGDIINSPEFTEKARVPDPMRLVQAYQQSAATLNLIRAFSSGGYAAIDRVSEWNLEFMKHSDQGGRFQQIAALIDDAIQFTRSCGVDIEKRFSTTDFYTSHEALLLHYEESLTREDSITGLMYDCSAHMVWVGERTRQLDGAHVEFLRGVGNPIGIKISNKIPPSDLVSLISAINPDNIPGRITIVIRMGANNVHEFLPTLVRTVKEAGLIVTWVSDPMHGNTESLGGYKTRRYENIRDEIMAFMDVHEAEGTVPGGIHLEMTGEDVTECVGGGAQIGEQDLSSRYHTHCDPRLNAAQSLEIAFMVSERLERMRKKLQ